MPFEAEKKLDMQGSHAYFQKPIVKKFTTIRKVDK
jgi:hypothetical protein